MATARQLVASANVSAMTSVVPVAAGLNVSCECRQELLNSKVGDNATPSFYYASAIHSEQDFP